MLEGCLQQERLQFPRTRRTPARCRRTDRSDGQGWRRAQRGRVGGTLMLSRSVRVRPSCVPPFGCFPSAGHARTPKDARASIGILRSFNFSAGKHAGVHNCFYILYFQVRIFGRKYIIITDQVVYVVVPIERSCFEFNRQVLEAARRFHQHSSSNEREQRCLLHFTGKYDVLMFEINMYMCRSSSRGLTVWIMMSFSPPVLETFTQGWLKMIIQNVAMV